MTKPDRDESDRDRQLEHAIADYLRRLDRGEVVDRAQLLEEYPSFTMGLQAFFDAMDQVERIAGKRVSDGAQPHGDRAKPVRDDWEDSRFPFIFGRYKVLRRLGAGGMGSVYLADDTQLHRQVALKIPQLGVQKSDPKWLERFVREARSNVQHPNICTIYDSGIHEGLPFICMAYIKGQPLTALITPDHLLPEGESASLVRIAALAAHAAHQAGIVHRDIKPHNIMIDAQGQPIIMDFGLARRLTENTGSLTPEGRFVGTVAYMSPEQFERNSDVTHSTDIYSLGVTFYELLTGRRPFQGTEPQIIRQIQVHPPEPPSRLRPHLHQHLEAICLRMMAKRAADRFVSMQALADELHRWLKENTAQSDTASELRQLRQQVKNLGKVAAITGGGLGLLGIADFMASHILGSEEPQAPDHHTSASHSPPHDGHWSSPFEDLISSEHGPVQKADPHFGTPEHDRAFWEGQQSYADTCAIRCQEFILQQFTGVDFPEKLLVDEAKEHGWYAPGHGTQVQDVGNLLELHGVPVNRYTEANVFNLANELAQGHKVIIGVDSDKLWGHNPTMDSMLATIQEHFAPGGGADHAVVVSGVDTTDPHHVKVIISDPGDGKAVASYPLEQFLHAWEGSQFFMVATQEPAPPHLPEMVHFDYAAGHLNSIADVPYEQFVERFEHHPDTWEHVLDHIAGEPADDLTARAHHDKHGHLHPDVAGNDHYHHGHDADADHHLGGDHHANHYTHNLHDYDESVSAHDEAGYADDYDTDEGTDSI